MPILDVEVVGPLSRSVRRGLVGRLADACGELLDLPAGRTWVRLRFLPLDSLSQFLVEAATLSFFGGILGVAAGWSLALLVSAATPLPARVTAWSVSIALALGAGTGLLFGVYPATRAARLDPITALRAE